MKQQSVPYCLMQSSLQLSPGDMVEERGDGITKLYVKDSEFKFTFYRTDHTQKKRYMFLGMEKIPNLTKISGMSGGTIELSGTNSIINDKILASKWFSTELNKVVYKYWSNGNTHPDQFFKILNER